MSTPRDIERLAQNLQISPSREADQRILAAAQAALNPSLHEKSVVPRPLWRIIMESPMTKWAVAAALIVGLLFVAHRLSGDDQPGLKPDNTIVKDHESPSPQEVLLARERQEAQDAFHRQDEVTLLAILEQGQDATQMLVADYLGQIGGSIALEKLVSLASDESNAEVAEAMTRAAVQIRQRLEAQEPNETTSVTALEPKVSVPQQADPVPAELLTFHVVDRDNGEPLNHCQVKIEGDSLIGWQGVTDETGYCRLDLKQETYGHLTFSLVKMGYCPLEVTYQRRKVTSWPQQLEIQMFAGVSIGGQVVNQAGEPVADFPLRFFISGSNSLLETLAYGRVRLEWQHLTIRTDEQGFWRSSEMLPGVKSVWLMSRHPNLTIAAGHRADLTALQAGTHVLTVWPGMTLTGSVLDEQGQPIPGFKVDVHNLGSSTGVSPHVTTDPNGCFKIEHMNAEQYCVAVYAPGMAPDRRVISLPAEQAHLDFALEPGYTASLQVVDGQGRPLAGADVYWMSWPLKDRSAVTPRWRRMKKTDAQGWVILEDLPHSQVIFAVQKTDYGSDDNVRLMVREEPYTVVLHRTSILSGCVVDEKTGQPINQFTLTVAEVDQEGEQPYWRTGQPGFDGRYATDLKDWGKVIRIEAPGYLPYMSSTIINQGSDQIHDVQLTSGQAGEIAARVYEPNGIPAAEVLVMQVTDDQHMQLQGCEAFGLVNPRTQTDPNGYFSLPATYEPNQLVFVHPRGFLQLDPAHYDAWDRIVLQPWGRIEVLVPDPKTSPCVRLDKGFMTSRDQWVEMERDSRMDVNGLAVFEDVPAGVYTIGQVQEVDGLRKIINQQLISVAAGQTLTCTLENMGHDVSLQLVHADIKDFRDAKVTLQSHIDLSSLDSIHVEMPETLLCMTSQEKQQWNDEFIQSEAGQAYVQQLMPLVKSMKSYTGEVDEFGQVSFRAVQPDQYDLKIELDLAGLGTFQFSASDRVIDASTVDLGAVELGEKQTVIPGRMAPGFSLPSHSGKTMALEDYRGKFVLVESGGPMKELNYIHSVVPYLKQVDQVYDKDELEILSLSLWTMAVMDLRPCFDYFISYHEIPWEVLFVEIDRVNEMPELFDWYAQTFTLIDPDGYVVMTVDVKQAQDLADLVSQAIEDYHSQARD